MTNDPVIHAKASKIVEAIVPVIKEQLLKQTHPMVHQNDYPSQAVPLAVIIDMMPLVRQPCTEALASLESSEREMLEGFAELMNKEFNELELNVCIHPSHIDRYLAEKGGDNVTR